MNIYYSKIEIIKIPLLQDDLPCNVGIIAFVVATLNRLDKSSYFYFNQHTNPHQEQ